MENNAVLNLTETWWNLSLIKMDKQSLEIDWNSSHFSSNDLVFHALKDEFYKQSLKDTLKEKHKQDLVFWSFFGLEVFVFEHSDFFLLSFGDFSKKADLEKIKQKFLYIKAAQPEKIDTYIEKLKDFKAEDLKKLKSLFKVYVNNLFVKAPLNKNDQKGGLVGKIY